MEAIYYTIQEVAERLKVHFHTVRKLLRQGEIQSFRVGNQIRVAHEDLEAYIQRQKRVLAEPARAAHLAALPTADQLDWEGIIDLGISGASDVSNNKHRYLPEAFLPSLSPHASTKKEA